MKSLPDPLSFDEALRAARDTRCVEIGEGVLSEAPRLFREQFGNRPAVVVADPNTFTAAGEAVLAAFKAAGHPVLEPFIFRHPDLHAEHCFVVELETALRGHEAMPVAVGSGTINDLTKLASHRVGRRYLCVATAASMDGYTAYGASITFEGAKQTFECPAPLAVVADLGVLAAAPPIMTAWGYADLLAKVPAGADWMLADAFGTEPIHPLAWNIVQGRLQDAVGDPTGVRARSPEAIRRLVEGLMLGGFAMQAAQSSRAASGAEHQFSHLWDMQHHTHEGHAPSHGLKVGIGTLAVTALYESLFRGRIDPLDPNRAAEAWPAEAVFQQRARACFGEGPLGIVAAREIAAKQVSTGQLREQMQRLRAVWPELSQRLRRQLLPFSEIKERLRAVGAATEPEQIGISRARLRDSFWQAFFLRRRFTVLDLAARAGLLDECLDEIFGAQGVWPIEPQTHNPVPDKP